MTNSTITSKAEPPMPADAAPESLDKVRDILFGGQMRSVETRLQNLDSRLLQAQETLRAEFTKQIDALDGLLQKEVQALTERLAAERAKRAEELKSLSAELKEILREHDQQRLRLEANLGMADTELRESLVGLTAELDRQVAALKDDKTSRSSLAGLLTDLASRLNGQTA